MVLRRAFLLMVSFFLVSLFSCPCQADTGLKRVLVINSYHQGNKWSDSIVEAIEDVVAKSPQEVELYIEYLDTKRNDIKQVFENYSQLFSTKYKDVHFSAIVTSDDNAMFFLINHKESLFPTVPVIFCGLNAPERYQLESRQDTTGVVEDFDLNGTLEVALHLFPATKYVAAVSDSTPSSLDNALRLEELKPYFSQRVSFIDLADYTLDELKEALRTLPKDSIVLHLNFFRDHTGRIFNYKDSIEVVTSSTSAPVFAAWDWYMGHNILGGKIVSGSKQGEVAAGYLLRILGGEDVRNIPVAYESPNVFMFDYKELMRFGIDLRMLPEGSIIVNTPTTFYYQHKQMIWIVVGIFLCLIFSILFLALRNVQKKRIAEQLKALAETLELQVQERTQELSLANRRLKNEMVEKIVTEDKLRLAKRDLEQLVNVDGLTKILNRRCMDKRMLDEWLRLKRQQCPLAVIMCDIDYFKRFNDTYGHPAGDACLVRVAQCIRASLKRSADFVARYGGEEFLIVLPCTDRAGAATVAAEVALSVRNLNIPHAASDCADVVTLSMGGCAMIPNNLDYHSLIKSADDALYQAKSSGRNTVVIADV